MNNKLSVIIVTFHSENIIEQTIKYLLDQEIIIVDNANNNELKNIFNKNYPNIKYLLSKENLGYSAGNNLGIRSASHNNILILNPDSIIDEKNKNELLNYIENIKDYGILCPNLSNDQCKIFSRSNNYNPVKIDWRSIGNDLVSGCALLLNKKRLGEDIFFDEKIFIYKEDTDLLKRVYDKKIPIFYLPNCSVNHIGSSSHNRELEEKLRISRQFHWPYGNIYFYKKHFGFLTAIKMWGRKFLSAIFKTLFYFLTFNKKFKIYLARFLGISSALLGIKAWYRPKS